MKSESALDQIHIIKSDPWITRDPWVAFVYPLCARNLLCTAIHCLRPELHDHRHAPAQTRIIIGQADLGRVHHVAALELCETVLIGSLDPHARQGREMFQIKGSQATPVCDRRCGNHTVEEARSVTQVKALV